MGGSSLRLASSTSVAVARQAPLSTPAPVSTPAPISTHIPISSPIPISSAYPSSRARLAAAELLPKVMVDENGGRASFRVYTPEDIARLPIRAPRPMIATRSIGSRVREIRGASYKTIVKWSALGASATIMSFVLFLVIAAVADDRRVSSAPRASEARPRTLAASESVPTSAPEARTTPAPASEPASDVDSGVDFEIASEPTPHAKAQKPAKPSRASRRSVSIRKAPF